MMSQYLPQAMGAPVNTMQAMMMGMPSGGMMPNALPAGGVQQAIGMQPSQPIANAAPNMGAIQQVMAGNRQTPMMAYQPNMPSAPQPQQNPGLLSALGAPGAPGAAGGSGGLAGLSGLIGQLRGANGGAGTVTPSVLPNSTADLGAQSAQALRNQFLQQTGQGGGLSNLSGLLGMLHG